MKLARKLTRTLCAGLACAAGLLPRSVPAEAHPLHGPIRGREASPPAWVLCAGQLGAPPAAIKAFRRSVLASGEDRTWLAALITVESRWNLNAVSSVGASGPLQLMPEGAAEGAAECGMQMPTDTQLQEWGPAIRLGSCLLRYNLRQVGGDWEQALVLYNGGWRQLLRLQRTGRMAPETTEYVRQVIQTKEECQ